MSDNFIDELVKWSIKNRPTTEYAIRHTTLALIKKYHEQDYCQFEKLDKEKRDVICAKYGSCEECFFETIKSQCKEK